MALKVTNELPQAPSATVIKKANYSKGKINKKVRSLQGNVQLRNVLVMRFGERLLCLA